MSVREEEERRKKQCPSRGLGLAAAAIGVGVGAALYYYFNKRPEHPDGEGATSSNWTCEEPQALHGLSDTGSEDIQENMRYYSPSNSEEDSVAEVCSSDSDGDLNSDYEDSSDTSDESSNNNGSSSSYSDMDSQETDEAMGSPLDQEQASNITTSSSNSDVDSQETDEAMGSPLDQEQASDITAGSSNSDMDVQETDDEIRRSSDMEEASNSSNSGTTSQETGEEIESSSDSDEMSSIVNISSDYEISSLSSNWEDFTNVTAESPILQEPNQRGSRRNSGTRRNSATRRNARSRSPLSEDEQMRMIQELPFRERSWSLEECSICCDVMLKDQNIKTLPCTHRFHSGCILPWLEVEQQQTCPNCRKQAV